LKIRVSKHLERDGDKKYTMVYRRLIFIVLLLALVACGSKQTPEDPVLEPEIAENTRVVDENTRGSLVGFSEDGTLRFSGSTPFLANLKAGDILVSEPAAAAPDGFLKKIIAVRQEGDEIIIATEQAALEEAILQGEVSIEKQLTPDDLASSVPLLEGVRLERRDGELQAQADNFEYEVNFDNTVLFDNDGNNDTREDQLRVDGKLFFSDPLIGVDIGLTYKKVFGVPIYPNGVKFRMGLQFRQEARMSVFSGIKLSHSEEIPVFKQFYKPIVFFIGPVPIVLTPVMNATLKLNGEFDAQVTFKAEAVANTGLGIEFRESFKDIVNVDDIRFKDFNAADVGFNADANNAQANVSARAELLVDGALNLYGIAGGFAGLNTYLQFDGKVPRQVGTPAWTLQGGVEARIGLNLDLILKRLKTDRKLLDLHFQIAEAVNQPPVINLSGLEGRKLQIGQPMFPPFSIPISITDPDGDFITNVTWSTDRDGTIGTGNNSINHTFTTVGPRVLTVTAVDPEGASSSASANIEVVNTPPDVNVTRPRTNETVTQGVGFVLLGAALDPNEGKLDCTRLRWTSSNSSDIMPANNCPDTEGLVRVRFTSSGSRTLTLTGTDSLEASDAVAVPITVEDNGRPLATILTPFEGDSFGGNFNTSTIATARLEDPDTDTLTYAWQFIFPGSPPSDPFAGSHTGTVTGARKGVTITESGLFCSDLSAVLRLTVKDETNTVTDERNIKCAPRPPR
jgi:hypothetical protein